MKIVFLSDGTAITLYTETLELSGLGRLSHRRASYVEPVGNGKWIADLSPVGGPTLGPFNRRSEALEAEGEWLELHTEAMTSAWGTQNAD